MIRECEDRHIYEYIEETGESICDECGAIEIQDEPEDIGWYELLTYRV